MCVVNDNYVDDDIIAALNDMHAPINKEVDLKPLIMRWVKMGEYGLFIG